MFDSVEAERNLLIINENPQLRETLNNFFCLKYNCDEAGSAENAFARLRKREYSVILSSFDLSNCSGVELVSGIQSQSPNSVIILIGGKSSAEEIIRIFRSGVFDYIEQPFEMSEIEESVERAFEQHEFKSLKNNYQIHLENLVSHRTTELDKALEEVESSYGITLKALVQALETRDFETHGHSERVVTFSLRLGHEIGLSKEALKKLELGALLHDIGKIGVPDAILRKPAALSEQEWEKMKLHPLHGQKILRNITFLEGAARIVAQHHEKWDGSGYPFGIRGEDIDIGARIFAVVDAFDAMISDRVYRRGRPYQAALEEMERCAGTQFDPAIVEAFKRIPREDWEVLRERSLVEKQEIFSFQTVVAELIHSRQQFEMVH